MNVMGEVAGKTLPIWVLAWMISRASAATFYVVKDNPGPAWPYNAWSNAAAGIQIAVDAASPGDTVLVSNGVYDAGEYLYFGTLTNRLFINKAIMVRSVNGPTVTTIRGAKDPSGTEGCGSAAIRCVYMCAGASLHGFNLTGGGTLMEGPGSDQAGGVFCESTDSVISNCWVRQCVGREAGGVWRGTLFDCAIVSNRAVEYGGGAANSILYRCRVEGNTAGIGSGGVGAGVAYDCAIVGNIAAENGGGIGGNGTFSNCLIACNRATGGGGADGGTFWDCAIVSNQASYEGGGVSGPLGTVFHSCLFAENSAPFGGGIVDVFLYDCVLSNNTANVGGAVWGSFAPLLCVLSNCVVVGNVATNQGGGIVGAKSYDCTIRNNISLQSGGGMQGGLLFNCRLEGNRAATSGGGAEGGEVSNCVMVGNYAPDGGGTFGSTVWGSSFISNQATIGGGAKMGTLDRCVFVSNVASNEGGGANSAVIASSLFVSNSATTGGGAQYCRLTNCTLVGNTATYGGACEGATLVNCIAYYNQAGQGPDLRFSTATFTCSPSLTGEGNRTNEPAFYNRTAGDYRLGSNSVCIDAGTNAPWMQARTDLDGNPRVTPGVGWVDMGAYEYPSHTGSGVLMAWLRQHGLSADGSADFTDNDRDGMSVWQEWRCGTNPTNYASRFRIESITASNASFGMVISWQSIEGKRYRVVGATNMLDSNPFTSVIVSDMPGVPPINTVTDATAQSLAPRFYRAILEDN